MNCAQGSFSLCTVLIFPIGAGRARGAPGSPQSFPGGGAPGFQTNNPAGFQTNNPAGFQTNSSPGSPLSTSGSLSNSGGVSAGVVNSNPDKFYEVPRPTFAVPTTAPPRARPSMGTPPGGRPAGTIVPGIYPFLPPTSLSSRCTVASSRLGQA